MNKANYTGRAQRNFPLSTEGLDFMQRLSLLAGEYTNAAGGNYILSGCVVSGNNVSSGTVIIDGELLPFAGGALQTKIRIVEVKENVTAGSETYEDAYVHRFVEFGSNLNDIDTFNWADLAVFPTNKFLFENSATKTELEALKSLAMPKGGIIMWSGNIAGIPAGFALCDGRTVSGYGTVPDLRGRFIVGHYAKRDDEASASSELQGDYGAVGAKGGVKQVTLTEQQIPAHTHSFKQYYSQGAEGVNWVLETAQRPTTTAPTSSTGGGQPHENRPPYYVLAFIIKVV
jgi:microcystin-dependent protein